MFLPAPAETRPSDDADEASRRRAHADYAEPDPLGRLCVRFAPRDRAYLVRRAVVQGPARSVVRIYVGEPDPLNLADATGSGSSDVADYAQPLHVPASTALVVLWETATGGNYPAGTLAAARIEVEDV